ncbi:MAG: hypothetical protein EOO53_11825 [Gammaproteobacteria bacterium]|nr:MAG: hypothetical protein EOO53_11825 [Gammaproteobacteria bacterium]
MMNEIGHHKNSPQLNEVEIVQNAALGAVLLWRFSTCYDKSSAVQGVPMPLLFIVLPLLLNEYTRDVIHSTNPSSGLSLFSMKLLKRKEELLSIHSRMLRLRLLTLKSLSVAVNKELLKISVIDGLILSSKPPRGNSLPQEARSLIKGSDKLGGWCAELGLSEIENFLRVRF